MSSLNKVILIGRAGKDPEVRYSQLDGKAMVNFPIATSDEWVDKQTGEKKEKTDWHRVVAFGKLGEICGNWVSKGRLLYVEGRFQSRTYEKDGAQQSISEIVANNVQFLSPSSQRTETAPTNKFQERSMNTTNQFIQEEPSDYHSSMPFPLPKDDGMPF
ncbi:MAG: single-stranded DNA-binding protein [Desulfobacterales bacterium]|nr:single-stranded DNA-binding protein [Desulfobacterales bacterium]